MKIDSQKLNEVAALMEDHGLTRVRLSEQDGRVIELERTPAPVVAAAPLPTVEAAPAAVAAATPGPAAPAPAEAAAPAADDTGADAGTVAVTAPMVGVFYAAPSPDADPFVHVGAHVHAGDTLYIIEAMKLMNEVVADIDGTVVAIEVADGALVEYGARIMSIEPDEPAKEAGAR